MRDHPRSIFHFVLLFVFVFSQITSQPVLAAATDQPDGENDQSQFSEAMPGPKPARMGSSIVPVEKFKFTKTALEIAARLKLLGYTLPTYPIQSSLNGLSIEPLVAYNLIVDSNVLSPSSYGPSAATFGAKFCNTSTTDTLTNVSAYIGNYDGDYDANLGEGTPGDITPGYFPRRTGTAPAYDPVAFATAYDSSTTNPLVGSTLTDYGAANTPFALQLASGTTPPQVDATRYIGTLAPGDCKTEYWVVTYPRKACSSGTVCDINNATRKDVTGGVKPDDDLWLPYWFWGTSTLGGSTQTSYRWNVVTMRNEISAMANKIWPNGDNKVPDEYIQAIRDLLGWDTWTPNGTSTVYPGDTVISRGIWYDLGNVGAGFDNNGDFVPDRNAWVQPIGDASGYDPGCFRLVHNYGLVIVKLNDGTEQLIPFEDQLYFENIPDNNNGAVGLVYYEYAALNGVCTANLTPYQEVASGYDNEKFNADYGAGVPPLQSQQSNMTLDKTGPNSIGLGGTINYSLTFTLPDIDGATATTVTVGQPTLGAPLTYSDTVPVGLQYVACSAFSIPPPGSCANATVTVDMSSNYPYGDAVTHDINAELWHSKDGGATWISGDPGTYTSSSTSNQLVLQWRLQSGVTSPTSGAAYTGMVAFQAVVPGAYTPVQIVNQACMKIGQGPGFTCDPHTTAVSGNSAITGIAWRDDGIAGGVAGNALQDGTEAGIGDTNSNGSGVTVKLYWDANGDGDYADTGDFLYGTTTTNASGAYCFGGTLSGTTCTASPTAGLPAANTAGAGNPRYIIVVDTADDDIPTGYGPTTATSYTGVALPASSVYGDATDTSEPSDFGFTPALSLDKTVMASTAITVGNTIEYKIGVTNNLPGDGSGSSSCVYNTYATSEGSRSTAANYVDSFDDDGPGASPDTVVNVFTAPEPDGLYAVGSYRASGTQVLDGAGFSMGPQSGTISNVKARVKLYMDAPFNTNLTQADYGAVEYWAGAGPTKYAGTPVGTQAEQNAAKVELEKHIGIANAGWFELNLGATNPATGLPWSWADLASGNSIHVVFQAGKQSDGDQVLIYIDAIGLQITASGTCGASSTTLNPVPLTDTFDDAYFDFISADPPVSSSGTGTLTWNNVGPLYPGQTRFITVYMRAAQAGSAPATINTATSTGSKFSSGFPANSPVSDTATVTIIANTNTQRYITGVVFDDNTSPVNGWADAQWSKSGSTIGYNAGVDTFIQYIPVELYGCVDATQALITNEGTNRSCAVAGGTWKLLQTTSTNASGVYTFGNSTNGWLAPGYYRVHVRSDLIVGAQTADVNLSGVCSGAACDSWSNSESDELDGTTAIPFVGELDGSTSVTRVNFGYNIPTGAYDIGDLVFFDWDGDGVQDAEDEPIPNVTMRLLAADGTYLTQTNTSGIYGFADRAPAYYTVEVNTNTLPSGLVQTKDPDAMMDNKSGFSLTADKLNVDFGYKPYGSGTIGDTVFKDVNGNGTQDGTGETGIAGITVALQVDWDGNGTYVTIRTATTDSNGKYLFTGLPVGNYRASISLSSNATAIPNDPFGRDYFPSNGTNTGTIVYMDKTLTALVPNDLTADFGFAPPAAIGDTVYQDINRNGTQDLNEPGINGITVTLYTFIEAGNRNGVYNAGEGFT
ncbi:MAG TPA: SdrD B-like domain-containing protein, partial [Anaerolineales bacterium]|nr:SdrD B-like domain-containing protein [Anaerolineales bacterium]